MSRHDTAATSDAQFATFTPHAPPHAAAGRRPLTHGGGAPGIARRVREVSGQIADARIRRVPELAAMLARGDMVAAREAVRELRYALWSIDHDLADAHSQAGDSSDEVATLRSARDELAAEATPLLARAPAEPSAAPGAADGILVAHPVQLRGAGATAAPGDVAATAAVGVADASAPLPHLDTIQRAFGDHDLGGVRAAVGGAAAGAASEIGAAAYATGERVAFASSPDLFTAAHEAAHVIQQRAGVSLPSGLGRAGDAYEQQADEVARVVVSGGSAVSLLPGSTGSASTAVQALSVDPFGDVVGAMKSAERTILEQEPANERVRREHLISNLAAQITFVHESMQIGADNAIERIRDVPKAEPDLLATLLDIAAAAAIGGIAGVAVASLEKRFQITSKFRLDGIKEALKHTLKLGSKEVLAPTTKLQGEALIDHFRRSHKHKLQAGKAQFIAAYWQHEAYALRFVPLAELEKTVEATAAMATESSLSEQQEERTILEWINVLAQARHGSMQWDPTTEAGSAGAVATSNALPPPAGDEADLDPAARNVNPYDMLDFMGRKQRTMQDDMTGVLEIHLWQSADRRISVYTHHLDGGMRLDGVQPAFVEVVRKQGRVRDVRINRVVRAWFEGASSVNPPKPVRNLLLTADGYLRFGGSAPDDAALAEFALNLPLGSL